MAKWESLFASNRPERSPSFFSPGSKSPSLNNTEVFPSVEKKENTRRASLDALSAFTLFSQEEHEPGLASCQPSSDTFSSLQSPGFKPYKGNVFQDKGPQHKPKQVGDKDEELPCSSNAVCNEAGATNVVVMHTEPGQHDDDECKWIPHVTNTQNSKAETSCHQLSDVNANVPQAPKSSSVLDASSEFSGFKACGSRHLDTKTDSQDADPNVLSNTLPSGSFHASGRQLSPEVLQLFKGKDSDSIVNILKTLSPFYPALQGMLFSDNVVIILPCNRRFKNYLFNGMLHIYKLFNHKISKAMLTCLRCRWGSIMFLSFGFIFYNGTLQVTDTTLWCPT